MNLPDDVRNAPRLAVITGARGGLGLELAASLDRDGWSTVLVDVHQDAGSSLDVITQPAAYVSADVTDEKAMGELGALLSGARDDFLTVAAAGVISVARVEDLTLAEWERVIGVNLTGTFLTLRSMIPAARAAANGRFVAIASDAAKTGEPWLAHYSASKFGILGLVQALAIELVEEQITVNAICPSIVDTPMMQQLAEQMSDAAGDAPETWLKRFVEEIPAGRSCHPRDVAFLVRMLASPESGFITGQGLNLAGGHEMQ